MPPTLALVLTLGFIAFLFWREFRADPNVSRALWIPFLWMFIIASRPVSQWLGIFGLGGGGAAAVEEGSSLDAFVYLTLMTLGAIVLNKRRVSVGQIIAENKWLCLFILYCFLAVFWADFPLSAGKRWIKTLGNPIMALIVLSEPDVKQALVRVVRWNAYLLLPISILWIKYFPSLGRTTEEWGAMLNRGVAEGKNGLGAICLTLGLVFLWYSLQVLRSEKTKQRRNELLWMGGLWLMEAYCLRKAHSSTSTITLLLSSAVMLALGLRFVDKRRIGLYAVSGIVLFIIAQSVFDVYGIVVNASGHSPTIEGRGRLWAYLLSNSTSPILGAGFESYWLGPRLQDVWSRPEFWWHPTQAHNGYVEAYINLGVIGLLLLVGLLVVTFVRCRQALLNDFEWGRFSVCYLLALIVHNWTEAGFKGLSVGFFLFFVIAINYSAGGRRMSSWSIEESEEMREPELVA
jgi:exopolysaccharide production protein ExoQ